MANVKISDLPQTSGLSGTELLPVVQNGTTYRATVADVNAAISATDVVDALGFAPENVGAKNQVNGYAGLDSSGKISSSQLPSLTLGNVYPVSSQAAMLALSANVGDTAVRSDISKTFMLAATPASTLANWTELLSPADSVTSVNGKVGTVTLTPADFNLGNVENKSSATIRGEITSANVTAALGFNPESVTNKNIPNGYVGLGSDGKVPSAYLPSMAATGSTFVVASQSAMLALSTAVKGDVAVRTDLSKSFILSATPPSTIDNWQELLSPTSGVTSVAGRTGAVTLSAADVGGLAASATTDATNATNISSGTLNAARLPATNDSNGRVAIKKSGAVVGTRRGLNLIPGSGVTLTVADNATSEAVDVTIASTGGGGSVGPATELSYGTVKVYPFLNADGTPNTGAQGYGVGLNSQGILEAEVKSISNKRGYVILDAADILTGKFLPARLPAATTSAIGAVKIGTGLSVAADGTLSATGGGGGTSLTLTTTGTSGAATYSGGILNIPNYTAPVTSVAGRTGVITLAAADISGLAASATTDATNASNISSGTLPAGRLPVATTSTLGGVKVDGTTITIASGVISAVGSGTGSVTSVGMTVPTGLSVSGSPITTSGTLAVTLQTGYSIPTTVKQTQWDTAYTERAQWDGGSTNLNAATARTSLGLAASATTDTTNAANISSGTLGTARLPLATATTVGAVKVGSGLSVAADGTLTATGGGGGGTGTVTSVAVTVPTGLTVTGSPITSSGTIAIALQTGYSIPSTASQTNWDSAYSERRQWDGSATNLNAATGRTSLGLATVAATGSYSDLTGTPTPYSLPTASTTTLGGVKVDGTTITITGGVISAAGGGGGITSAQAVGRALVFGG